MNVSNDFCPFMCWSVYWCFVVKVSIPQESKNTTHETDFYSLPCTLYLKNVSLINLLFILIVKTGKLSDGVTFYLFALVASLLEDANVVLMVSQVTIQPFVARNVLRSEFNCSHIREI